MTSHVIVVIFGCVGGLSDVGKFCLLECSRRENVELRSICLAPKSEGFESSHGLLVPEIGYTDIVHSEALAEFATQIHAQITHIYTDDPNAQELIFEHIKDLNPERGTIISAFGNREPGFQRHLGTGSNVICNALRKVEQGRRPRMIQLSSMGVGDDFVPFGHGAKMILQVFYMVVIPGAKRDILALERNIRNLADEDGEWDYVLVRAMGLDPNEPLFGSYTVLKNDEDGQRTKLRWSIAKPDFARFLVDEALNPTVHRTNITVGQSKDAVKATPSAAGKL